MTGVEELVETLLYEGYALYPYTPGATKNATPTPFGIVYPPAYAAGGADDVRRDRGCRASPRPDAGATLAVEVRFLEASGVRHEALARRVDLPATALDRARRGAGRVRRSTRTACRAAWRWAPSCCPAASRA